MAQIGFCCDFLAGHDLPQQLDKYGLPPLTWLAFWEHLQRRHQAIGVTRPTTLITELVVIRVDPGQHPEFVLMYTPFAGGYLAIKPPIVVSDFFELEYSMKFGCARHDCEFTVRSWRHYSSFDYETTRQQHLSPHTTCVFLLQGQPGLIESESVTDKPVRGSNTEKTMGSRQAYASKGGPDEETGDEVVECDGEGEGERKEEDKAKEPCDMGVSGGKVIRGRGRRCRKKRAEGEQKRASRRGALREEESQEDE